MVNNEIILWRAMIDRAIQDSLRKPLREKDLTPYPAGLSTDMTQYQTIRQSRTVARDNEKNRVEAQEDILGDTEFEWVYSECYDEDISGLREQLNIAWEDIKSSPDKSKYYMKQFNTKKRKKDER